MPSNTFNRQRDYTQALFSQALAPQTNQTPLSGLARILTAAITGGNLKKMNEQSQQREQETLAQIMAGIGRPERPAEDGIGPPEAAIPPDRQKLISALVGAQDPNLRNVGLSHALTQPESTQKIIKMGVKDQPGMMQNAVLLPNNQVMPIGEPFKQRSGVSVNVGSKGQTELDKTFAKDMADFSVGGGFADAVKNLDQLKDVSRSLASGQNLTGPVIGSAPDFVKKFTNPESISIREQAEEVVQRNLKEILGAQFTEKEGQALIKRAYNENLKEAENKRRIDRVILQMSKALNAKRDAASYFNKHGTLQGYTGKQFTAADFSPDILFPEDNQNKAPTPQTQADFDALAPGTIYIDPDDGKRYRK